MCNIKIRKRFAVNYVNQTGWKNLKFNLFGTKSMSNQTF